MALHKAGRFAEAEAEARALAASQRAAIRTTAAFGGTATHDIGAIQTVFVLSSVGYLTGGCLFGTALFRARVLARWAAALLAAGTVATVALAVLPESFNRPLAVPTGVALIGLGIWLWRDQPTTISDNPTPPRAEYAAAQ